MIIFVDLKHQISETPHFSFWCTVNNEFKCFSGVYAWTSVRYFEYDYEGDDIERYTDKIPFDYPNYDDNDDDDRWEVIDFNEGFR